MHLNAFLLFGVSIGVIYELVTLLSLISTFKAEKVGLEIAGAIYIVTTIFLLLSSNNILILTGIALLIIGVGRAIVPARIKKTYSIIDCIICMALLINAIFITGHRL